MKKVLISVAPVDGRDTYNDPKKIAEDVIECHRRGAAMVHLHCRDAKNALTANLEHLRRTVELIREKSDIIMEISTGGVSGLTIRERCVPCRPDWVECNSLNVGSVNLGDAVYCNPRKDVEYCVEQILAGGKVPETEVFELGMLHTLKELDERFGLGDPLFIALVLGHAGAMPATSFSLRAMTEAVYENFPQKERVRWGITQAHREDWSLVGQALDLGADSMRVGFEDSRCIDRGRQALYNYEIVESAAGLLARRGMEAMSPAEARSMLGIGISAKRA